MIENTEKYQHILNQLESSTTRLRMAKNCFNDAHSDIVPVPNKINSRFNGHKIVIRWKISP